MEWMTPEGWESIARQGSLAVVIVVFLIVGLPFIRWFLENYVPSKKGSMGCAEAAATSAEDTKDDLLEHHLLDKMDKQTEAMYDLSKNVVRHIEATTRNQQEIVKLLESNAIQSNRMEASINQILGRVK